jgi:hypothetical protein
LKRVMVHDGGSKENPATLTLTLTLTPTLTFPGQTDQATVVLLCLSASC